MASDPDKLCLIETTRRLFGDDAADLVWAEYGGLVVYVRETEDGTSSLAGLLGIDRARAISRELGGVQISVPVRSPRHRRERILTLSLAGLEVKEMARELRLSERAIYRTRNILRENGELPLAINRGSHKR